MLQLIYDRTQADVNRVAALAAKGWDAMTEAEKLEWYLGPPGQLEALDGLLSALDGPLEALVDGLQRGSYNAADLNRVTAAMNELYAHFTLLGYAVDYRANPIQRPDLVETQTIFAPAILDESNLDQCFTITNGTSYWFALSGSVFSANNSGVDSSTATTTLTAKRAGPVSFSYSWGTEANYDKFTLKVAGVTVENAVSGSATTKSWSGTLAEGDTIVMTYTKDGSNHTNGDTVTLYDLTAEIEREVEVHVPDPRDPYTWFEDDTPTAEQLETYRQNVAALRGVLNVYPYTPAVPESMDKLDWRGANDIEKLLTDVDTILDALSKVFLRSAMPWAVSGTGLYFRN